jgi:bifunctional non-homologous end joining protein LigD
MARTVQTKFISPMLLLKADRLPDDPGWTYELKLDGYRALAFKAGGKLHLRSRNDRDFTVRYVTAVDGLANVLPARSVPWYRTQTSQ